MRTIEFVERDIASSATESETLDFFTRRELRGHIPQKHASNGPGLPHHRQRHRDDPIYFGIFVIILALCGFYLGWHWL